MDKNTIAFIPVFLLAVLHLHDGIKMLCLKGRHAKKIKVILTKEKFLIFCKKMGWAEIVFSLTLFAGAIQVCYFRSGDSFYLSVTITLFGRQTRDWPASFTIP